ncbi:MAG: co-chaperone GroES [Clostridia bacterium]|nr:co-chaperone GroES [Clostridia bacterium]
MKIRPLLDKIVLKPIDNEEKSVGGIILPTSAQEKPSIATVVAVGEGGFVDGHEVKMLVKPNDKVLYSKYAGTECKIEDEKYIVIKQADILAVIE